MITSRVSTQEICACRKASATVGRQAVLDHRVAADGLHHLGHDLSGHSFRAGKFPALFNDGHSFCASRWGVFLFLRARGASMPTLKQWRSAVIVGVLLLVFGMGSVAMAEQWVSSGLAAALVATAPLWAMLFSMLWRNFPTRSEWIGVGVGLLGVGVLSLEGNLQSNPLGVGLILFATASWALGSVWMRRLDMPKGAMGNAAEMLAGGVILLVVGLLRGEQIVGAPTPNALLAMIYLITFGSLATLTAYMYLLKTVSPALATSYAFVNPAIALLLGVVIGGEEIAEAP